MNSARLIAYVFILCGMAQLYLTPDNDNALTVFD
jgi:hypothetical protein